MFTNPLVSGLFVLVAIAVFIILCYKNVHTGIAAIIAAIIAAFGSTNAFYVSMFEVFPSGVSLVSMMFTVSGLLGFLMDETGCSKAVGNQMIKWLGKDCAWMAISATAVVLMLAGVGTFMFVVVVVAAPLMKSANLPRKVGMIAAQGIAPAINFCMPVPNVPGSLPNMFLGTSLYDAPVLSIVTGLLGIVMFVLYQLHLVARANGEGYDGPEVEDLDLDKQDLPSFATSAISAGRRGVRHLQPHQLHERDLSELVHHCWLWLSSSALSCWSPCTSTAARRSASCASWSTACGASCCWPAAYGFGQGHLLRRVIAVLGLNLNPHSVAVIAALCTDGISAMMVWLPMFGQTYLDMGVNAGALRRLLPRTTQTFAHAQSIANTLGVFGLTHKQVKACGSGRTRPGCWRRTGHGAESRRSGWCRAAAAAERRG